MQEQLLKDKNSRSTQGGFKRLSYKMNAEDIDGSSQAIKYFASYFDVDMYPPTPDEKLLHWSKFTRDFWSVDMVVTKEHLQICEFN